MKRHFIEPIKRDYDRSRDNPYLSYWDRPSPLLGEDPEMMGGSWSYSKWSESLGEAEWRSHGKNDPIHRVGWRSATVPAQHLG